MTKFYTKTGDDGYTGRLGKGRLPKHHILIEAIGTIDEASSALGVARAQINLQATSELILKIQKDLYHIMSELSATPENAEKFRVVDTDRLEWLEGEIERYTDQVEPPGEFIVPGDTPSGAALALSRTIVRRCERRVTELNDVEKINNPVILPFLNRLSSLCFILELSEIQSREAARPTLAKE
jgi:cob(I)alamin adenosyltransferase